MSTSAKLVLSYLLVLAVVFSKCARRRAGGVWNAPPLDLLSVVVLALIVWFWISMAMVE